MTRAKKEASLPSQIRKVLNLSKMPRNFDALTKLERIQLVSERYDTLTAILPQSKAVTVMVGSVSEILRQRIQNLTVDIVFNEND